MDNSELQQKRELYRFAAFCLDPAERRLWCADEPVALTPKQFDLLFYFVENAGRATKKSELLDAVWADSYIEETTLARNVSWLRKTLAECAGGGSFIETVPKLGYRFTAEVKRSDDDHDTLIIEEQTVQYIRGEETITIDDAKLSGNEVTALTRSSPSFAVSSLPVLLVIFCFIAGSGYVLYRNQTTRSKQATALTEATELNVKATVTIKNITVDATYEAVDAGLEILPGDVIRVSATGIFQPEANHTWTFQGDENAAVSAEHAFQKAAPWSLVGWIGTESDKTDHFQASKNPAFQAQKSGALYLAVNDLVNNYSDNRGGLNVAVVLYRQYNIYAEDNDVETAWGKELVNIHKEDTLEIRSRGNVAYWQNGELYDLDGSDHSTEGHLAPKINARSLIGKIGSRPPFKVGKDFPPQVMKVDGWLFLSVNDRITDKPGSFKNNSGEITVDVEAVRQTEEFVRSNQP